MPADTLNWWTFLCLLGAFNVLAWAASAAVLRRRHAAPHPELWRARRLLLLLSAGYVFGCAYRSAFPVYDVQRLCLVDSWFSSVIVGRAVATVAELCFVAQWAVLLSHVARAADSALARAVSRLLVPLIAAAEICSWHAVLTTSNLGHVIEESIWGLSAALLGASLLVAYLRSESAWRPLLAGCSAAAGAYVLYMFTVDVPMYWARWVADELQGRSYLSVAQGLADVSARWVVSHRWDDWKSEVVWMSLYFSVAVWLSIGLVHAPLHRGAAVRHAVLRADTASSTAPA